MTPSQLSAQLRHIAAKISNSKSPRRDLVARDLKNLINKLNSSRVAAGLVDKTFAELLNANQLDLALREAIDEENSFQSEALARKMQGKRDRGDPQNPLQEPLKLINLDLENRDSGTATFSGGGLPGNFAVDFSAEEALDDWWHEEVMSHYSNEPI